jgi:hypothetical protein
MKKATGTAFETDFGFKSPNFSVDALGNIIANAITTTEPIGSGGGDGTASITSYNITENASNTAFQFSGVLDGNPTIELERGRTYTFNLSLEDLGFYVFDSDGITSFTNITDSDGNTGIAAQGRSTGIVQLSITSDTGDRLIYSNEDGSVTGFFDILDPTGSFGSIAISNTTQSTGLGTGALRVSGGASIAKDLYLGGSLVMEGTGDVKFDSSTNLTIGALNKVIVVIDGQKLGEITDEGIETPIANTTIENTAIGSTTPSTASFTSAEASEAPTTVNSITNKAYVDSQDIALSIALGS